MPCMYCCSYEIRRVLYQSTREQPLLVCIASIVGGMEMPKTSVFSAQKKRQQESCVNGSAVILSVLKSGAVR